MKIDARLGDVGWDVYHAEWMIFLEHVLYVDGSNNTFAYWHPTPFIGGMVLSVRTAKKITFRRLDRLVIINPIPDDTYATPTKAESNGTERAGPPEDQALPD